MLIAVQATSTNEILRKSIFHILLLKISVSSKVTEIGKTIRASDPTDRIFPVVAISSHWMDQ